MKDKFKVKNILKIFAIESYANGYDGFLMYGNNYYLYVDPNEEWNIFRYDFDVELRPSTVEPLLEIDGNPLKALFGPEKYYFAYNIDTLEYTLRIATVAAGRQYIEDVPGAPGAGPVAVYDGQEFPMYRISESWAIVLVLGDDAEFVIKTLDGDILGFAKYSGLPAQDLLRPNRADSNIDYSPNPLFDLLMSYSEFQEDFKEYVRMLAFPENEYFNWQTGAEPRILEYLDHIREAANPAIMDAETFPWQYFNEDISTHELNLVRRQQKVASQLPAESFESAVQRLSIIVDLTMDNLSEAFAKAVEKVLKKEGDMEQATVVITDIDAKKDIVAFTVLDLSYSQAREVAELLAESENELTKELAGEGIVYLRPSCAKMDCCSPVQVCEQQSLVDCVGSFDSYCETTFWDSQCIEEARLCGLYC